MIKRESFMDLIGWSGGAVSLSAYGLVTNEVLAANSYSFLLMNVFACICLIIYTLRKKAFANTAINSVYLLITLAAMGRALLN